MDELSNKEEGSCRTCGKIGIWIKFKCGHAGCSNRCIIKLLESRCRQCVFTQPVQLPYDYDTPKPPALEDFWNYRHETLSIYDLRDEVDYSDWKLDRCLHIYIGYERSLREYWLKFRIKQRDHKLEEERKREKRREDRRENRKFLNDDLELYGISPISDTDSDTDSDSDFDSDDDINMAL